MWIRIRRIRRQLEALKAEGTLRRRCRLRQCKYLNNLVEQDHRTVKQRTWLAKGYGSFQSAWRTLQGIETVTMIRKGRVRWVAKGDAVRTRELHQRAIWHYRLASRS
jgi:transposase, IS6 family